MVRLIRVTKPRNVLCARTLLAQPFELRIRRVMKAKLSS